MELNMAKNEEEEMLSFPASPSAQFFTSSILSISVIAVLETEVPVDDSCAIQLLRDVFLPINPRFSSIMVKDNNGEKEWKKVEVNLKDHTHVPTFPKGKSKEYYDQCFNEYMSKICLEQLPESRPLWEIHIIKYPTSNAAGTILFKLHHALGDGYSLMGALLSCLQRADNPSLPLTFPAFHKKTADQLSKKGKMPKLLAGIVNTMSDFVWGLLKSTTVEDDRSPLRSGDQGVEFRPIEVSTMAFSLDQIKQIKDKIDGTINDIMCGVLFLGLRLYMEQMNTCPDVKRAMPNALVMLNTRNIGGYKSVNEMLLAPREDCKWGNQFAFLYVPIPPLTTADDPLSFVFKTQQVVQRQRTSSTVYFNGKLLEAMHKYKGPETTAKYIHSTLNNSSVTISNMVGPTEQMVLANHPVKGLYFSFAGAPQSVTIGMTSYMRTIRVALGTEKGFIDSQKLKSCIDHAFHTIFKAAVTSTPPN